MIDFHNLKVVRMIMHTIHAKLEMQNTARATYSKHLIDLNHEVEALIKKRLIDAAGKNSKAFELEFGLSNQDTCYVFCKNMKTTTKEEFIITSTEIADLLASSQERANIPGGYLLIMDCRDEITNLGVYILMKAEPHEALQQVEGQSQITLVQSVFLSPSQKLYKIGIVYEKENPTSEEPNEVFGCFLFDDQFRQASHPAEYFYQKFLGFTVGKNAKIQSKRFYDKTEQFIKQSVADLDQKSDLLNALRIEFTTNKDDTINPDLFAQRYFATTELRSRYQEDVLHELPTSFLKDETLLKNKLYKRKINFPNNINITGPDENFDERVHLLTADDLGNIDLNEEQFTFIRILGKPFTNDRSGTKHS